MTTGRAATLKGCSRQAVYDAIKRGDVQSVKEPFPGAAMAVKNDSNFENWTPKGS